MTPREQLLAYVASSDVPTDPIRIMKGLFLFTEWTKEGRVPQPSDVFKFRPMSYGPCSPAIYEDLDALVKNRLIEVSPVPGQSWSRYRATPDGKRQLLEIIEKDAESVSWIERLRTWCDGLSFADLLKAVYAEYPAYAVNSVFKS